MIYVLSPERLALDTTDQDIPFTYIDSPQVILDYLSETQTPLCVDTETTGLDFTVNKTVMFQIGDLIHQFIIDTRYHSFEFLREVLEDPSRIKVLHNAKFDYKFIKNESGIELEGVVDTYLQEKVLFTGHTQSNSLKSLVLRYLGEEIDKETRLEFLHHTGPFTIDQIVYGAKDITYPILIYQKQQPALVAKDLVRCAQLENHAVLAFADIEFNGIKVNEAKWLKLAEETLEPLIEMKNKLDDFIQYDALYQEFQESAVQTDLFVEHTTRDFVQVNWGSPKQVLSIFQKTHPNLESVGADELLALPDRTEIMNLYMQYKKQEKLYNSYGPSFLDHIHADGLIHTRFTQVLNTGRVSSAEPNMQQIPADNRFRNCFEPQEKDWVFVSSDFSSQELCVIAFLAKDPVWLQALEEGKDLHSVCASLVFKDIWSRAAKDDCAFFAPGPNGKPKNKKCDCPEHKALRDGVKAINFGLAYGMSEFALADRMGISVKQASDLIEEYFRTFPNIQKALERFGEFGKRKGFIKTMVPFKRRRYFPQHKYIKRDFTVAGKIERASKNTPIQGTSADMTKYAMVLVRRFIKEHKVPVKMVMVVHDQIDTICHKDYADTWTHQLNELMEQAAKRIITNGLLKAETEQSPVWKK